MTKKLKILCSERYVMRESRLKTELYSITMKAAAKAARDPANILCGEQKEIRSLFKDYICL